MPAIYKLWVLFCILLLGSCQSPAPKERFKIGFSQCGDADLWRKTMLTEMERELTFHPELELIYRQANDNSETQIRQVRELIQSGIDLLIISPNEASPLTPVVEEAYQKGIPVIVVDRKIASGLYTNYIGADNYQVGRLAGEYAANLLKGEGSIIEVIGLPASSPAIERKRGFKDALAGYPEVKIIKEFQGDWVKQKAKKELAADTAGMQSADLIFAHNDVMAMGAKEATEAANLQVKVLGVDALSGTGAGLEMIGEKKLTASVLYPTGGSEAIRNALKILQKESLPKETFLQTLVVDSSNVRIMQLQTDKISSQQREIQQQQQMLAENKRIYNSQRTVVYILTITLFVAVFFAGLLFYSRHLNRRINRKLAMQNEEISRQSQQLKEMSEAAGIANEAKINFFTKISHEFRTPLTLIIGPIEEMLEQARLQHHAKQQLSLIKKNAIRLLRLVNQLIDFRKLEFNKMQVKASELDLVQFLHDIVSTFQQIARKRNIDCRLITNDTSLRIWADPGMLDKVFYNLLSNAFKFTPDHGSIIIRIHKTESDAIIEVEDNGIGMSNETLAHAFDLFYQGSTENYKGSGLGLALCKELIELQYGTIEAKSTVNKGTSFIIQLPLGKEQYAAEELHTDVISEELFERFSYYNSDDLLPVKTAPEKEGVTDGNLPLVVLIDDNPELRSFLKTRLQLTYEILEASDGQEGLELVFEYLPDLVICDVMMPVKDGTAFLKIVKADIRTAHIPVLLLTAKASKEQQMEGLRNQADAYIIKPFDFDILESTMKGLLDNRHKLRQHLQSAIPADMRMPASKKNELRFLSEFKSLVNQNISNEQFGVDEICRSMGVSKVQLYRKVKALLNCNINEYILQVRLQRAKYLLQHEDLSVSEVAYQTGFASPAYFSTVFKNHEGVSPSVFKGK
jgi:signal transduction histidine kinase/AraC-like DNA-binding protein